MISIRIAFLDELDHAGTLVHVPQVNDGLPEAAARRHGDVKGRAHPFRPVRQCLPNPAFLNGINFWFLLGPGFDQAQAPCRVGGDVTAPDGLPHDQGEGFQVVDRGIAATGIDALGLGVLLPRDEVLAMGVGDLHGQFKAQLGEVDQLCPPRGLVAGEGLLPLGIPPFQELGDPELPAADAAHPAEGQLLQGLSGALLPRLACFRRHGMS
jgi:hypothetical protein